MRLRATVLLPPSPAAWGQSDIADLLEATLAEEKAADEKLTDLAEAEINETAFAAG